MSHTVIKANRTLFLFMLLLGAALFFAIFLPMRNALKKQVAENYLLLAESKRQTVAQMVGASVSSAGSLSSRTAIRDFLLDYRRGDLDWDELQALTTPKYGDGAAVIQNLRFAARMTEGGLLSAYPNREAVQSEYADLFTHSSATQYRVLMEPGRLEVVVYSPVLYQAVLLGYDIVAADLSSQLAELTKDGFGVRVLEEGHPLLSYVEPNALCETCPVGAYGQICVAMPIDGGHTVLVSKASDEVFGWVNRVSLLSILGFLLGLAAIFAMLYAGLMRAANAAILRAEDSRDLCMSYASLDALTGAYTRFYLDHWIASGAGTGPFMVVMVDVDSLKNINDTYGHEMGDTALKCVTHTLMSALDERDFAVRLGGDEFVLIFEGKNETRVCKLLRQVNRLLCGIDQFQFPISISFGVEEAETPASIYRSIELADQRMYAYKRAHKSGQSSTVREICL